MNQLFAEVNVVGAFGWVCRVMIIGLSNGRAASILKVDQDLTSHTMAEQLVELL